MGEKVDMFDAMFIPLWECDAYICDMDRGNEPHDGNIQF